MSVVLNILGIFVVLGLMYVISSKRKAIRFQMIVKAIIIQLVLAILLVKIPLGSYVVSRISDGVTAVINCGYDGLSFVFGSLANGGSPSGFIMAFQVLGNIVFLSALVSLLYYIGVLGFVVKILGKLVGKVMGTSDVESFVSVANMFLGQTESPILVGKYIRKMTDSEIMVVLVSGMGSMSVSILGGYTALGIPMEYLLIASAMVPIGSILVAKMILPETEEAKAIEEIEMDCKGDNTNVIEAVTEGAVTGMHIAMSIGASLIAMVAMVTLINKGMGIFGITLEQIFSYVFAPFGFFMGLDASEVLIEGNLLGSKLVMNEFVAFQQLGEIISEMSERTAMIVTISLCGFANFGSLGVCVSGISVICPEKRSTLARLVFKAMLGGIAVSMLSALIVGLVMLF